MAQVQITSRDNLSIWEKDALVRRVEERVAGVEGIEHSYARTMGETNGSSLSPDVIGVLQLDFFDWDERRPAAEILDEVRGLTADIAGIGIQIQEAQGGPSQGKPVQLRVTASNPDLLPAATDTVRGLMENLDGLLDIEDSLPRPGVEWRLSVDRTEAARYGADVTLLGQAVQMLTGGLKLADYRPDDATDEVDIRVRFPAGQRNLEQLEHLRLSTSAGLVPIRNFVDIEPAPRTGTISRIDGQRTVSVDANVAEGALTSALITELRTRLASADLPEGVTVTFAGEAEDQQAAMVFLITAFGAAIFLMLMTLVTQFNSLYQTGLVLSAIVFSTAGVLIGLMITGRPFGIVMGGIGVIALAGIVVNNNIVLIDSYNEMRARGHSPREAALRSAVLRLRPVLLTSFTTVLGLMPMVLAMNVDLVNRSVSFGAPSTQWWTELSSAIAGGLAFATVLTLLLTPCLLVLGARIGDRMARWRGTTAEATPSGTPAASAA
jgi:multidrug efflux pump